MIGRENWLIAGGDAGGETLAEAMTIIEAQSSEATTPKPTEPPRWQGRSIQS